MYSDEYDDEQDDQTNGSFIANFYNNNKVLVWIFIGIIIFIIIMSLLTKGGSSRGSNVDYSVNIYPDGDVYVNIGRSTNLVAQVKNNPKAEIVWTIDDINVAKVDNGNVTGLNYGKTKVTATYTDANNKVYSDSRNITVGDGDQNIPLTDVSFKEGDLFMPLNETYQIALVLTPSRGYVENETFISSNANVVKVDNRGVVTSVGEGEAVIVTEINNGQFRKELKVYVDRNYTRNEIIITPNKISFDGELLKIKIGSVENLSYTVEPQNANVDKLIWKSSDESIVTVENGKLKGISEGRATVTVSSVNGTEDKIDIEVEKDIVDVTDIEVAVNDIYLTVGQSQVITPVIVPDNASNKALVYTVSDTTVAAIVPNDTGTYATLTGLKSGKTTLIIRSAGSTKVVEKVLNITVTGSNSGGNGSGGSSTSQGFTITSRDANGEGFINSTYERTKPNNNGAKAPLTVTVEKKSSAVDKLVIIVCNYPASTSCSPLYTYETYNSYTFTLNNVGEYVIRVEEYDKNNNKIRSTDKFAWVKEGENGGNNPSGSLYTVDKTTYSSMTDAKGHAYSTGTTITYKVNSSVGYIKLCSRKTGVNQTCTNYTVKSSYTLTYNEEGTYAITVEEHYNGETTARSSVTKYISIKSSGGTATPAQFSCSGLSNNACHTGQAASYCDWCNGMCKKKGECTTASVSPTATIYSHPNVSPTGNKVGAEVSIALGLSAYKVQFQLFKVSANSNIDKVIYCVHDSSGTCSVASYNTFSYMGAYLNRTLVNTVNGYSNCASGYVNTPYYIDKNVSKGGISFKDKEVIVPFCFEKGQSIKVKVLYKDGSDSGEKSYSF